MEVQADIWATFGVPIQAGERFIGERMEEVRSRFLPVNDHQALDVARLLDVPFFSAHTATDNLVAKFLNDLFAERQPKTIEDVKDAAGRARVPHRGEKGAGLYVGKTSPTARAGKICIDMTGGTEGPRRSSRSSPTPAWAPSWACT